MAGGPGGREVGRVNIRAVPDTSHFAPDLKADLERLERTLRLEIPVDLDGIETAEARLDALARDRKVELKVDVDRSVVNELGKVTGALGSVGAAGGGLGGGGLKTAAVVAGAVVALLPVISTLILAIPGLVASIALPIGAILVGLKGIKKAAEVLVKPFEKMAKAVSGTFARELTPVFRDLAGIFPTLTVGLQKVAAALSGILGSIVDGLTSPRGVALLTSIFDNLARALDILAPVMKPLTEAFLTLVNEGMKEFVRIAPSLAGLADTFAKFIDWADKTGILKDAFKFLGQIILGTIGFFLVLIGIGTIMAGAITWLSDKVNDAANLMKAAIGASVDAMVSKLGGFVGRALGALAPLGGLLSGLAHRAMSAFLGAIRTGGALAISFMGGLPSRLLSALGNLGHLLYSAGASIMSGFIDGIRDSIPTLSGVLGSITAMIPRLKGPPSTDKRLLVDNGRLVMQGFMTGLQDGFADVERLLGGFTAAIPAAAPAGGFVGRGSGRGRRGGLHLTVNNPVPERASTSLFRQAQKAAYLGLVEDDE